MCGIFGEVRSRYSKIDRGLLARATHLVRHRGPDGWGFLLADPMTGMVQCCKDPEDASFSANVGLGHRRLSIIDLSDAAAQPMSNGDSSIWIVYNGEIFNYIELREELQVRGHFFHTASDTEVILHAYQEWGRDCLNRFNGMWAFVILDLRNRLLFCARDRMGVKPFYYYSDQNRFLFASEIKQFFEEPSISREAHPGIVYDYLVHGVIDHSERTFYRSIRQLRGGCFLTIDLADEVVVPRVRRYWSIDPRRVLAGATDEECAERFLELLDDSVRLRLRSDVPVGSCLSGGIDSSSIVCLANRRLRVAGAETHQNTVSSCFEDPQYDEQRYIEQVASCTGVRIYRVFPAPDALVGEIDRLLWHQDEPFGSTSIYAQWCVFRLASEMGIRVMLDGQGADELLAGYHFYFYPLLADSLVFGAKRFREVAGSLWSVHGLTGRDIARETAAGFLKSAPRLLRWAKRIARMDERDVLSREFLRKGARESEFRGPERNRGVSRLAGALHDSVFRSNLPALLHYEDRNSMAHSVESRVPFLDYRLVEYVFSLPDDQKIREGVTKFVFRNAVRGIVPDGIVNRMDKMGFVTPEEPWLKGVLKENLSKAAGTVPDCVFDKGKVVRKLNDILSGRKPFSFEPWRWANFGLWWKSAMGRKT